MKLSFDEVDKALEIMGKGMLGIFAVILILTVIVSILPIITKERKEVKPSDDNL